jgi:hypothetical protein
MMGKKAEKEPKRLEELLLDDSEHPPGSEMGIDQDVRIVGGKRGSHFSSLVLLFIFCLLVLGVGYFYLQSMMVSPSTQVQHQYYVSPKLPIPERYETAPADRDVGSADKTVADQKIIEKKVVDTPVVPSTQPPLLLTVTVGPLISDDEVEQAVKQLKQLGFQPEINRGRGIVAMIRLLEGTYPADIARTHLIQLKKCVKSAFLLPQGDQISVYAGSFHQEDRAKTLQHDLEKKNIRVTLVDGDVEMDGTVLTVIQADQQTAREVANHLSGLGLKTSIREKK